MATLRDDNLPLPNNTRRHYDEVVGSRYGVTKDQPDPKLVQEYSALAVQVSGDHYKKAKIQPIEFIHANSIPFCEANVIKYIFRWKSKNGIKDLEKAKHYIDLLIELESKNV